MHICLLLLIHNIILATKIAKIDNIFLTSKYKHILWYSLEASHCDSSNEYPQHMFSIRNKVILIPLSLIYFSYFSITTYVVGAQKNHLNETVLLSIQNTFCY